MDTTGRKTPAPLPIAAWQALGPAGAAREVHARVAALPPALQRAALAWLQPEPELAAELAAGPGRSEPADNAAPAQANPVSRPLHGVPCFAKDLYDVAGVPTWAGSTFLPQVRPTPGDSRLIRRVRALGAAVAGKTHLVEFASGLTGENPHYGDCPHPLFPDRLSGGSSSGSAALVAAGAVPFALGTDTGGSVRVPAAFCGLYGFRLTPGDEFIRDAFPLSPTLDTAGWFTAGADDLLTTWRALTGGPTEAPRREPRGCGLPGRAFLPEMDPGLDDTCTRAAAEFSSPADAATRDQLLGDWRDNLETYLTIGLSEAHAVHRAWLAPYRSHYDPAVWQRFADAGRLPPEKIAGAHHRLQAVRQSWAAYFRVHDFLVLPAVPFPALRKSGCTPAARRAILTLTAPASLGGLACLTLPVALGGGLTAGLQVILPRADSPVVAWILGKCA